MLVVCSRFSFLSLDCGCVDPDVNPSTYTSSTLSFQARVEYSVISIDSDKIKYFQKILLRPFVRLTTGDRIWLYSHELLSLNFEAVNGKLKNRRAATPRCNSMKIYPKSRTMECVEDIADCVLCTLSKSSSSPKAIVDGTSYNDGLISTPLL